MGVKRYELDADRPLLPGKGSDPGPTESDNRLVVNGVLWVLRSGAHWQDLPERYGEWKTAHNGSADGLPQESGIGPGSAPRLEKRRSLDVVRRTRVG